MFKGELFFFTTGSTDSVWVKHCIKDRYDYYYNLETGQGTWEEPEDFQHNCSQLGKEEIQVLNVVCSNLILAQKMFRTILLLHVLLY